MKPPRALWVPFPLGRPFGAPNQPEFQLDVLRAALKVLEQPAGPVIVDYPHDAPAAEIEDEAWSCVLPLPPLPEATSEAEQLAQGVESEVAFLLPWHAEFLRRGNRSLFGLTNRSADDAPVLAAYLAAFAAGQTPERSFGLAGALPAGLRPIVDDLKTLYLESASAQPGQAVPNAYRLNRWLYHETRLGDIFYRIRDRLAAESEAAPADAKPPAVAIIPNMYRNQPRA